MKSDHQLRNEILEALKRDAVVDTSIVSVHVRDGTVMLSGHTRSHAELYALEKTVGRVAGLQTLVIEVNVRLCANKHRTDSDIASTAEHALQLNARELKAQVHIQVEQGWITLTGEVEWEYQRHVAERALLDLCGVVGMSNLVSIRAREVAPKSERVMSTRA